jgi:hypothetical protein
MKPWKGFGATIERLEERVGAVMQFDDECQTFVPKYQPPPLAPADDIAAIMVKLTFDEMNDFGVAVAKGKQITNPLELAFALSAWAKTREGGYVPMLIPEQPSGVAAWRID